MENSRVDFITLENELETLQLYVEMEKIRHKNLFNYEILVDEKLDLESIMIPPLIIQPFVENSIKHGFLHNKSENNLQIEINSIHNIIKITIEDNGIGREKARERKKLTKNNRKSLGLELTSERLENLGKTMGVKASIQIKDLYDKDKIACGTLVELIIPFKKVS